VDNIIELYKRGKSLENAINSELFKKIRRWQAGYGYERPRNEVGNWLRQCPIRDHYDTMYKILKETNAKPIDTSGEEILKDENYRKGLVRYGEHIEELTRDIWEKEYLLG